MDYNKHKYILAAVEELQKAKSWTGKTHVQKTLALTSFAEKDLPFEFVLYKHGPYSFDVDQELDQMLSYDAVQMIPQGQYGPTLKPSSGRDFPEMLGEPNPNIINTIHQAAQFAGARNVVQLESLATSAWIRCREEATDDEIVRKRLQELKPHLNQEAVEQGVRDSKKFIQAFHLE